MSLLALIKGKRGPSGFGFASTADEVTAGIDLSGKTVLITGVNAGLGRETGRVLASRGAHVIGAARSVEKAQAACKTFDGDSTAIECELTDLGSVGACVETISALDQRLDAIICNAGIMALPELEKVHGIEKQFFTNHIGHFVLVTRLIDRLSGDGRVVMLSSSAHKSAPRVGIELDNLSGDQGYRGWRAYGQSKLANLLFAVELSRRFEGTGRTANAVHPGVIRTELARHMGGFIKGLFAVSGVLFTKSVEQGAATSCYVATHPDAADVGGRYFADCNIAPSSSRGRDRDLAEKLWAVSEDIVERVLEESSGPS